MTAATSHHPPSVTGVVFRRRGRRHVVRARREVVVSAGVVGSPKLLLLSGIGPRQHLSDMGEREIVIKQS